MTSKPMRKTFDLSNDEDRKQYGKIINHAANDWYGLTRAHGTFQDGNWLVDTEWNEPVPEDAQWDGSGS